MLLANILPQTTQIFYLKQPKYFTPSWYLAKMYTGAWGKTSFTQTPILLSENSPQTSKIFTRIYLRHFATLSEDIGVGRMGSIHGILRGILGMLSITQLSQYQRHSCHRKVSDPLQIVHTHFHQHMLLNS